MYYSMIGIIGGIGVGYSTGYKLQTAFNTFWAFAIALAHSENVTAEAPEYD